MSTGFVYNVNVPQNDPPTRVYVHEVGWDNIEKARDIASRRVSDILGRYDGKLKKFGHIIGIVWNDRDVDDDVTELYGFTKIYKGWPGRPRKTHLVFKNGVLIPGEPEVANSKVETDIRILLDLEREHRRGSKNLSNFMRRPVSIYKLRE